MFAFLIAPRKLQSLAAAVQADAAATSSVRSTAKVVTNGTVARFAAELEIDTRSFDLEAVVDSVGHPTAKTPNTSIERRTSLLLIIVLHLSLRPYSVHARFSPVGLRRRRQFDARTVARVLLRAENPRGTTRIP